MITKDDRNEKQKCTHNLAVVARDKFMSGWGLAANGASRVAWACETESQMQTIYTRISNRKEMVYVNVVDLRTYRAPRGTAHFHIYVGDA